MLDSSLMVENIISSLLPISSKSLKCITDIVEYVELDREEVFITEKLHNNQEYFVINGVCKSYLLNPDGEEITISFFTNGNILSPHTTRTISGKSSLNFKTLTDVKLGVMDASKFENLMVENLEIREFGNTVLRNELKLKVEKEINMASLSAKDRLIRFREQYPSLENEVPHTDIATYLGITNISLSRLRRDLMK